MKSWLRSLALVSTLVTSSAWAVPYFEIGDAGQTLDAAQAIGAGVDVIHGTVDRTSADLFSFNWGGGAFTLDTFGSIADTQLFLFSAAGQGVWANDEAVGTFGDSQIIDPALAAGLYYIGISVFDFDPYSVEGAIFPSAPFNVQFGAQNDAPLSSWHSFSGHSSGDGDYVINFNTPTAAVPEPPMLALFGIAFAVVGFKSRIAIRIRREEAYGVVP